MSDRYRGEDRLGRVLRDTVEGRGRGIHGPSASAGVGSRNFAAGLEGEPPRPRVGAFVITAVLGAAAAAAFALWPSLTSHRAAAPAAHPSPVAAAQHSRPAAPATGAAPGHIR
jgi:hypothetical protein